MNKKKLLTLALVAALIAIVSMATLAWFNDTEEVTNKFYFATSDNDQDDDGEVTPDEIFSITVTETVDVDGDGKPDADTNGDGKVDDKDGKGAKIENILPGDVIIKTPVVTNTGSYDQWVRVTLTFETKGGWYKVFNAGGWSNPVSLLDMQPGWEGGGYSEADGKYVYTYYLKNVLKPGEKATVFTTVTIPTALTQTDMAGIGTLDLKVKAEAVQVDNVGADTAKDAFAIVMP